MGENEVRGWRAYYDSFVPTPYAVGEVDFVTGEYIPPTDGWPYWPSPEEACKALEAGNVKEAE